MTTPEERMSACCRYSWAILPNQQVLFLVVPHNSFLIFQLAPSIFHRFHIFLNTILLWWGRIYGQDSFLLPDNFIDFINKITPFIDFLHLSSLPECAILLRRKCMKCCERSVFQWKRKLSSAKAAAEVPSWDRVS